MLLIFIGNEIEENEENKNVVDDNGHGTMVASIIAESTPENVKIVPIKVLDKNGEGGLFDIILALNKMKDKVDIINLSLGVEDDKISEKFKTMFENAFTSIRKNDVLIICAAGNSLTNDKRVFFPASSDSTIAVSGLKKLSDGKLAFDSYYSCYGSKVDFSAPGTNLDCASNSNNAGYNSASGTSIAAPFVTSAFCLLKSEFPNLNSSELFEKLKENVDDLGKKGKDEYYGYGSVNFRTHHFEKPIITKLDSNKVNPYELVYKATVFCDDKINLYACVQAGKNVEDSDWKNVTNESSKVEQEFHIYKNGVYDIYFKDVEGDFVKQQITVSNLEVKIDKIPVSEVKLNKNELRLKMGSTEQLKVTINPSNSTIKKVVWSSNDVNIALVDQNGKVIPKKAGTTIVSAEVDGVRVVCKVIVENRDVSVKYRTHVENIGWQNYVKNGQMAGTTGRSLRLEGINISLESPDITGGIEYRTHVENIGWQNYVKNGAMAGTSGRALRLEAIQIRLTGEISKYYDIYYRVHCENFGWLGWAKNGNESGSAGFGYRLEGIQVVLVKKGGNAPGSTKGYFKQNIFYQTHVQDIGWQGLVGAKEMSGTTGRALRLEGIKIFLPSSINISGNLEYSVHVENIGWQSFVRNGAMAGTTGRGLRLEAIKIKLTENLEKKYDIYYSVHCENFGWLGWAKNGAPAGSEGFCYRLEGIKIVIVNKGDDPPGVTSNAFVKK